MHVYPLWLIVSKIRCEVVDVNCGVTNFLLHLWCRRYVFLWRVHTCATLGWFLIAFRLFIKSYYFSLPLRQGSCQSFFAFVKCTSLSKHFVVFIHNDSNCVIFSNLCNKIKFDNFSFRVKKDENRFDMLIVSIFKPWKVVSNLRNFAFQTFRITVL